MLLSGSLIVREGLRGPDPASVKPFSLAARAARISAHSQELKRMTLEEKQILFYVAKWVDDANRKVVKTIRQLAETEKNYQIIKREIDRVEGQLSEARKRGAEATLTLLEWLVILEYFDWRCAHCRARPFQVMGHIVPLPHAGTVRSNCIPLCYRCKNTHRRNESHHCAASFAL